ncbi:methylmalonyl-CoA epimerase [Marininema mesophilum]|uniref:Methylmalonyl-CoA epimerase n=1 Tax=Marininema mesophilum TaxID=1048340 RepID=A0A1H2UFZ8_9BACL|nr:methylmalonyl-CoA epimerase [Marininema mesophilum]SDW55083.1 methylmalonyl-CoA epimerase [Marininema mesophilum]
MSNSLDPQKIDHIGIAVRSLETALPLYRDVLGLSYLGTERVDSEHVRVAFFKLGETKLELLEPTSEESAIARFIEKKGEGIHHIALRVEGIEGGLNKLSEAGLRLIHEQPKVGAGKAQVAFVHPRSTGGVLYELCEPVLGDQLRQKG